MVDPRHESPVNPLTNVLHVDVGDQRDVEVPLHRQPVEELLEEGAGTADGVGVVDRGVDVVAELDLVRRRLPVMIAKGKGDGDIAH